MASGTKSNSQCLAGSVESKEGGNVQQPFSHHCTSVIVPNLSKNLGQIYFANSYRIFIHQKC